MANAATRPEFNRESEQDWLAATWDSRRASWTPTRIGACVAFEITLQPCWHDRLVPNSLTSLILCTHVRSYVKALLEDTAQGVAVGSLHLHLMLDRILRVGTSHGD